MSTSPAENPVPGVVTFTARGDAALDQLADALVTDCDGSPASIADLLERVLEADIEDLAEALGEAGQPDPDLAGREIDEVGPAVESPDEAARRRLGARMPGAAGAPQTRSFNVGR
ncbi:hypothetical protein CFH99_00635 [Nocardioides aromaticivorans]|uniref:Uncharacterized protein n=1 Tax=Nocardioides aromaticivorans TaxID=200618 RepID=A0ABX7PEL1_9ACTN|nr:hypothetical protein [Nocardioides aromaticivorans]QSR24130.1 hypothetical protein CFH99_00635 [Nocardioides aromaticivorans]